MQSMERIREILGLIVCPACHGHLALAEDGTVDCNACGRQYPVVDGIPVLLVEKATQKQPATS
jgi:uncharacterized protein